MRVDTVSAHAYNNRIRLSNRIYSVAEPARFLGSTRCIVLRIKPEHDVLSSIVAERMLLAVAPRQSKSRRLLPFKIRHGLPPLILSGYSLSQRQAGDQSGSTRGSKSNRFEHGSGQECEGPRPCALSSLH